MRDDDNDGMSTSSSSRMSGLQLLSEFLFLRKGIAARGVGNGAALHGDASQERERLHNTHMDRR